MKSPTFFTREKPSAELRWNNGVLEQAWLITSYGDEFCEVEGSVEWRAVEEFTPQKTDHSSTE